MRVIAINPATRKTVESWDAWAKRLKKNRKKLKKTGYPNFDKALEQAIERMERHYADN
jgi:hypothetical protein